MLSSLAGFLSPLLFSLFFCYLSFSFSKQGLFIRYLTLPCPLLFVPHFLPVHRLYHPCFSLFTIVPKYSLYDCFFPSLSIIPSHFSPPNPILPPSSPFTVTLPYPHPHSPSSPVAPGSPCQAPSSKFMCRGPISVRGLYFNLTVCLSPRAGE